MKSMFEEADWNGDGKTTDDEIEIALNNIDIYPILSGYSLSYIDGAVTGVNIKEFNLGDIIKPNDINTAIPAGIAVEYNSSSAELPKGNIKIRCDVRYVFTQA